MKQTKRILSFVLCLLMLVAVVPVMEASATSKTVSEAMEWCESNLGDKVGTGQCVAFIQAYYSFLGVSGGGGDGKDYATNSLPSGFSRVQGGVPQVGDILVYTGAQYGHVAIYAGGTTSYHQNMAGKYVEKKTNWPYNKSWYSSNEGGTKSYWGYIRPDFAEKPGLSPEIHDNKNAVSVGEEITFWYAGLTPCSKVEFCFEKNGTVYYRADSTASRTFTTYFENEGTYSVFVQGYYNGEWYTSRKISVYVLRPEIHDDKNTVCINEPITFTYYGLTPCDKVEFCIDSNGTLSQITDSTSSTTWKTYFTMPGTFQVYVRGYYYDSWCYSEKIVVNVVNHSYTSKVTTAATCTTDGVKTFTCRCGKSYTEKITKLGHSYGAWTKLNDTQHQRVCSRNSSHIEKANHSWNSGAVTKAATCSATGTKTYTCTVCNATKTETIAINSSNHVNTTNKDAVASTCTVKGYTAGVYCNDCKKYISGHAEQPLAAHKTTTQNAKAATCTAEGYTGDQVCTVCKQTITKGTAIAKKAHTLTTVNQKNAGCTTAGYTGDQVCTVCKQTISKGQTINALGHANADSNGNCTRCGTHIKDVTPSQPSNPQPNPNACKYCGQVHTGPFGWLIKFFHSILAIFKR